VAPGTLAAHLPRARGRAAPLAAADAKLSIRNWASLARGRMREELLVCLGGVDCPPRCAIPFDELARR
jgi:hypothetical protein